MTKDLEISFFCCIFVSGNKTRDIMKAKELAERLMEHPDFEVEFRWFDCFEGGCRTFTDIGIDDIGYSDKVIVLDGELEQ